MLTNRLGSSFTPRLWLTDRRNDGHEVFYPAVSHREHQRLSERHEGRLLIEGEGGICSGHQVERIIWPDEAFEDGRFGLALISGKANSNGLVIDEVSVHAPTDKFRMSK